MSKSITFSLGPATGLAARQLTITRMHRAGDDSTPAAAYDADVGAVDNVTVELADNVAYQAKLVDTSSTGETSRTDVLNFVTGDLMFPGPRSGDRLAILLVEDLSSSSSSPSSSSTSSASSSSSSSSSSSASSSSSSSSSLTSSGSSSSPSSSSSSSLTSSSSSSSSPSSSSQSSRSSSSSSLTSSSSVSSSSASSEG